MPERDNDLYDLVRDALHVLNIIRRDVLLKVKVPTPVKIVHNVLTDIHGCIGGGLDNPVDPEQLWMCPSSHEAWLHRILITSPAYPPAAPLDTGQIMLIGSTGQIIDWTPEPGMENNVIPVQIEREGGLSAPHLTPGERLYAIGDQLPVGIQVRFDLQINLVAGVSPATPFPYVGTSLASTAAP